MSGFDPIASLANLRHEFGEHGGVNMSIEVSTTFTVMEPHTMPEIFAGRRGPDEEQGGCYLYGRHFNPTVYVLGRELAAIEGTEAAYCTSSGMSAVAATLMQLCCTGEHIVASNTIYGGTFALLDELLPSRAGVHTTFVDIGNLEAVEAAMGERTRVLYLETMSNPTLCVADIPRLSEIAHRHGVTVVVDNTFCPVLVSPAQHGADIVVHSLTKFISGGSDIIAGAICGPQAFIRDLMDLHTGALMLLGPTMDPKVAFNLSLRLPHLGLRMTEHSRRAQVFAERLVSLGIRVIYPGLPSHPQHALLARLANPGFGFGGLLCLDLPEPQLADRLMALLQNDDRFGYMAVSLGYFDTLMSRSASSTSSELSQAAQAQAGISPGLVRISMGYTGALEQRWQQLEAALRQLGVIPPVAPVGTVA